MADEIPASWLDAVTATVSGYASSALQLGEDAAATLAGALARVQALPDEAATVVAIVLIILAIPLVLRIDSAIARRRRGRAILDSARLLAAIAAAAGLLAWAGRGR